MPDIFSDVDIRAPIERVFGAVSTAAGLDTWWTKTSAGGSSEGEELELGFGPGYDWRARVTKSASPHEFELELVVGDADWLGTRVRFRLEEQADATRLQFSHTGWPANNEHWRISCYCWPIYLRLLKRSLEAGEIVPYEKRLDV